MSKPTTCKGRTKKGKPCTRKASNGGYCYQHMAGSEQAGLTEKQRRFVEAYMGAAAGNATEAARLAGYAASDDNSLASIGNENLRKLAIREAINKRVDSDPLVATRFDRQRFWTRVMLGTELDGDEPPAMRDRLKAASDLARAQGDFIDRVEHSGPDGKAIQVESSPEERRARIAELTAMLGVLDDDDA